MVIKLLESDEKLHVSAPGLEQKEVSLVVNAASVVLSDWSGGESPIKTILYHPTSVKLPGRLYLLNDLATGIPIPAFFFSHNLILTSEQKNFIKHCHYKAL